MVTELLHIFGFEVVFDLHTYSPIEKQSVTNALPANSLRFAQIYFFRYVFILRTNPSKIVSVWSMVAWLLSRVLSNHAL